MNKSGLLVKPIQRLTARRVDSSLFLFLATIVAVIVANSPLSVLYEMLLNYPVLVQIGHFNVFSHQGETMTLLQFTNDVLMVLFFLQVGLEIKQEALVGELSSLRKAIFPVIGACGGMLVPVLLFFAVCHTAPMSQGLAIPMATDIAFALAVLSMLGSRVPTSLKAFLAALAVADDIGGILVIAIFYSSHLNLIMLLWVALCLLAIFVLGRLGVRNLLVYYIGAFVVWTFFLHSGIHTTISGVLVAFLIPARPHISTHTMADRLHVLLPLLQPDDQKTRGRNVLLPHQQLSIVHTLATDVQNAVSPMQRMEQQITPIVHYLILPLFAFLNAGVSFGAVSLEGLAGVPLAIVVGLFVGKPLGIFLFSLGYLKITRTPYPKGMTLHNLFALSILGGIGFTVALFFAHLAYVSEPLLLNDAKLGIFVGSMVSGIVGYTYLRQLLPPPREERKNGEKK